MAALASLALVGCNRGGGGGDSVATVNGEAVSMDEYHRYLERKPLVQVQTESGAAELPVAAPLGFQAMRDLINRRVLLQVAKDDGVFPTDADVKAELDFQTKRRPDFIKQLQAQGLTIEEIKRDLTLDLAKERIVTKGITVTKADADDFIAKNPDKFMEPEQAKLRLIVVRDEATKKLVDADIASGRPFSQVAVQYSTQPNVRQSQGMYPMSDVSRMPAELQQVVHSTDELKATDWKKFGQDWVKFYIERKEKAKKVNVDDTMKEAVRRAIAMDRGSAATDMAKRLVDKLRTSKVVVNPPSLKTPWDTAFKSLQESDVNPTTRTGGSTAGGPAAGTAGAPGATTSGG